MATNPKLAWLKGPPKRNSAQANAGVGSPTPIAKVYHGGVKDASGRTAEFSSMSDTCPVCTSDRYLNPKLRLLVSPCYHKMCESCIDRLYTLGPGPCPTCGTILRKMAFAVQTFEDLTVEREVAVRRRIAKEFNKRREDFKTLREYNDYLEEVEDITFNLINSHALAETEARIESFRKANAALVALNIQRDERDAAGLQQQEEQERAAREEAAREAKREEEEERWAREAEREAIIDGLETGASADAVIARTRRDAASRRATAAASAAPTTNTRSILPLPARSTLPDPPHVPLTDNWLTHSEKYHILSSYDDPSSEPVRADATGVLRAGGYRLEEAWERAIRCAVIGLGVPPLSEPDADAMVIDSVG